MISSLEFGLGISQWHRHFLRDTIQCVCDESPTCSLFDAIVLLGLLYIPPTTTMYIIGEAK